MANITAYLHALEARLAPSLDAQSLQERLTEAENHLRDRAREFEEVGLPPAEAEARAVAAFGSPGEYAEDVPARVVPPAAVPKTAAKPPRDLASQLAASAMALGVVAMLTQAHSVEMAAAAVVAIFGLGALFGRPTSIHRMGALALASAAAAFLVMEGFYEPMPSNGYHAERIGVRLRGTRSDADYDDQELTQAMERFQRARNAHDHEWENAAKDLEDGRAHQGGYVGPSTAILDNDLRWRGDRGYIYILGLNILRDYDTAREADRAWKRDGDLVQSRLQEAVGRAKPVDPELDGTAFTARCALVALSGGVAFLASMVGIQALALVLRAFFASLFAGFRRRPESPSRTHPYGEPELH